MESNTKQDERTPGFEAERLPGGYTLSEWQEHARRDDCLERMVPSDLRQLLGIIERQRNASGSTDALRSALAEALAWHERRIELVKDYRCLTTDLATRYEQHTEQIEAIRAALSGSPAPSTEGLREWQPIETAPHDDYRTILVVVEAPDGDLTHRLAMWEPENDDWTVFMANWNPQPLFWMPLPPAPDAARTALAAKGT